MKTCTGCAGHSSDTAAFCGHCGTPFPGNAVQEHNRQDFITLPPGVVPVAATNTGPAPSNRGPTDFAPPSIVVPPTVVASQPIERTPAAPGGPVASDDDPRGNADPPKRDAVVEDDPEATRMTPLRVANPLSLAFNDGRRISVHSRAVIGRAPDADAHAASQSISVGAHERSVSKSHALIEFIGGSLQIVDLGSVNGVMVVHPDGSESEATAERAVTLQPGDEIELGDVVVTVERAE